jgi:DNA-directed RNA polymerase specialized sigma24 family protein
MPLAEHIAPHLPNLRRFARLLTGSQKAGDTAVARLLEAIVAATSGRPLSVLLERLHHAHGRPGRAGG